MNGVPAEGLALGVTVGETTVFRCRGMVADERVGTDTIMYGASLTKQMIAFLLARAVEAGLAEVSDPVITWLPALPEWMSAIQLSRHRLERLFLVPTRFDPQPNTHRRVKDPDTRRQPGSFRPRATQHIEVWLQFARRTPAQAATTHPADRFRCASSEGDAGRCPDHSKFRLGSFHTCNGKVIVARSQWRTAVTLTSGAAVGGNCRVWDVAHEERVHRTSQARQIRTRGSNGSLSRRG